ncbi:enoyl-CoA hydratase/isomerase family protein [Phenylobacterium sp. J367]|uniref:enoyl-CoA hydratase/isomerase family protein n=1 Tax=Phenylobacterium sp. J367 TaxID=2898435 RepID=UPI0021519E93|nr:enoyl-CoA hydratase-related protein [Phenylobacterium sp. J367]MCR5879633.1 enoyl-CoA hydratase-related protein [Phenylobacterium sp. J367]
MLQPDLERAPFEAEQAEGLLRIRLARPEKMNALADGDCRALVRLLEDAAGDPAVRCVLITGSGRAFCAGRDISSATAGEDASTILTEVVNPLLQILHDLPQPTIAAVNGAAMGIGLGLALACDIVFAAESARFSSPFARLGAALDSGGHYFLPRRLTPGRTLEMIYTGDVIEGPEALRLGLVDRLTPDRLLEPATEALARRIVEGPQAAFRAQKALIRASETLGLAGVLAEEARIQGELARTSDYAEGVAAFQARRAPQFHRAT